MLCIPVGSFGEQPVNIDSLKTNLLNAKEDKARVEILNKLSVSYLTINQKLAKFYNQQSLTLAEKMENIKGRADATYITFKIYKTGDQNEQALQCIRNAGALYLKCGELIPFADCLVNGANIENYLYFLYLPRFVRLSYFLFSFLF